MKSDLINFWENQGVIYDFTTDINFNQKPGCYIKLRQSDEYIIEADLQAWYHQKKLSTKYIVYYI